MEIILTITLGLIAFAIAVVILISIVTFVYNLGVQRRIHKELMKNLKDDDDFKNLF